MRVADCDFFAHWSEVCLVFTANGLCETAAHLNENKLLALPYLSEVYKEGLHIGSTADYHNKNSGPTAQYTKLVKEINGQVYEIRVVSKEVHGQAYFVHYAIGKTDKVN